jgi:hypothetical protein
VLWTAKLAALTAMPILVTAIFYGYSAILGTNFLALDIGTFILAVAMGQWIGCRVWIRRLRWAPAPLLIGILAAMFVAFSYCPPAGFLFEDPGAGGARMKPHAERPGLAALSIGTPALDALTPGQPPPPIEAEERLPQASMERPRLDFY